MADKPEVKETYNIPGIGYVRIVYAPKDELNGPFYADIEEMGRIARFSKTQGEALQSVTGSIESFLKINKMTLENKLKPINESLMFLELSSINGRLPERFKVETERSQ